MLRNEKNTRYVIIKVFIVACVTSLTAVLASYQLFNRNFSTKANATTLIQKTIDPARGLFYDRNGKILGYIAGVTNRTELPLARIPIALREATVAIEDKRFYEHDGVDWVRVIGAAVRNAMSSDGLRQGGSTITMQLVKNLYDPNAPRDFTQKIKEAHLAPPPLLSRMNQAGLLGRKSGQGFYSYR